jgi:hypothetical protein
LKLLRDIFHQFLVVGAQFGLHIDVNQSTTAIYNSIHHQSIANYQFATALSFAIMALMFVLVLWQWRLLRGKSFQTVTGKGFSPRLIDLGPGRWLSFARCVAFFVISVVLPIGQLILGSFFQIFGFYQWDMLTLEHYRSVLGNSEVWRAFRNTFLLGLVGASTTMLLGAIVAYISARTRWAGRQVLDVLAWLPWMMPGMVLASPGKILQVGPPQDIYQRPNSEVVATFFGAPNLLDATVTTVEAAANSFMLGVRGESWQGVAYGDQRFAPGDRVHILVRPEDIRAGVVSDEVFAEWRGDVLNSVFRGARRTLLVRTQAGELRIEVPALTRPKACETIEIGAAKSALWAFAYP